MRTFALIMIAVGVSFPQLTISVCLAGEAPNSLPHSRAIRTFLHINRLFSVGSIMRIDVMVANESHAIYADEICEEVFISARERGTGIARRTPEYVIDKMKAGKAVIAVAEDGRFAGFSYIETWGHKQFVANSGLIVAHAFRGMGIAMRIKRRIFQLSRELFPEAKIFSITTGAAVMKMNYELGFRPVPFALLTDDPDFWRGCQGCRNYGILESNNFRMCLCTGLLYDPQEHIEVENPALSSDN